MKSAMMALLLLALAGSYQQANAGDFQFDLVLGELQEHEGLWWRKSLIDGVLLNGHVPQDGLFAPIMVELILETECESALSDIQVYLNFQGPLADGAIPNLPAEDIKHGLVEKRNGCRARIDITRYIEQMLDLNADRAELYVGKLSNDAEGDYDLSSTSVAIVSLRVFR